MSDEPVKITLRRKTKPLDIEGEDGVVVQYTLKEMTGKLRDMWLNKLQKAVRYDEKSKQKVQDFEGVMAELISACAWTSGGLPLPVAQVQEWPSSQQEVVFKICQQMNGLDKLAEEAEKKD